MAKPTAMSPSRKTTRRRSGKGGSSSPWRPVTKVPKRRPGLAAAKQAQQAQQGRGEGGRQAVPTIPVDLSWPDDMQRERQHCRTAEQLRFWTERWAEHLSGRIAQQKLAAARPQRRVIPMMLPTLTLVA